MLLRAVRQRAGADAATLQAPALLPGAVALTVDDPEQCRYLWLNQRTERYDHLLEVAEKAAEVRAAALLPLALPLLLRPP